MHVSAGDDRLLGISGDDILNGAAGDEDLARSNVCRRCYYQGER